MAQHNEIGKLGEEITRSFLVKQGFSILATNYRTKYGEIDIVAEKDNVIRFIEVKSIEAFDFDKIDSVAGLSVSPFDNLTDEKWRKIVISAESYLQNRGVPRETRFQIDLACVYINTEARQGLVRLIENVHKE